MLEYSVRHVSCTKEQSSYGPLVDAASTWGARHILSVDLSRNDWVNPVQDDRCFQPLDFTLSRESRRGDLQQQTQRQKTPEQQGDFHFICSVRASTGIETQLIR